MTAPKLNKIKKGVSATSRSTIKNSLRTLVSLKGADFFDEDGVEDFFI